MNQQELIQLLDKYLEGNASKEEEALLFTYYKSLQTIDAWDEKRLGSSEEAGNRIWAQLQGHIRKTNTAPVVPLYKRKGLQVAAAIIALMFTGFAMWRLTGYLPPQPAERAVTPVLLGPNKVNQAVLTLNDGTAILLDSAANGVIARQGNTVIKKWGKKLIYEPSSQPAYRADVTAGNNRIITARGVQYQVLLPDGSTAWLNAASALRFAAGNTPAVRRVEVEGEVYFEVAKNKNRPFRVAVLAPSAQYNNAVIEVLGTQFNINAYADEAMLRTTLLEGSLKVHTSGKDSAGTLLAPGQQAQVRSAAAIAVKTVDADRAVAWQKGLFDFEGAPAGEVMRQLARWYDIEVIHKSKGQGRRFSGRLSRGMALADVLKILEHSGIQLEVQGRIITVLS